MFAGSENCCVASSAATNWHNASEVKGGAIIYSNWVFWHGEVMKRGPKWLPHMPYTEWPAVSNLCMADLSFFCAAWQFQSNPFSPFPSAKSKIKEISQVSITLDASQKPLEIMLLHSSNIWHGFFSIHAVWLLIMGFSGSCTGLSVGVSSTGHLKASNSSPLQFGVTNVL